MVVALDLTITPELRREGLARDLVRHVQDLRKEAGLEVQDRIRIALDAPGEIAQVLAEWKSYLARETLALEVSMPFAAIGPFAELKLGGETFKVALVRAAVSPGAPGSGS
jgi:isoleucyl-tRNA synthetase